MKKQRKEMQGITLIALVVTIVVLLILAGVSIAMLSGENGIISQAQDAKDNNKKGEIEEQVRLAVMAAKTAGKGEIDFDELNSELDKIGYEGEDVTELPKDVTIDGVKVTIKEDGSTEVAGAGDEETPSGTIAGKRYDDETDIEVGNVPVTVPGGATISGIPGEYESVDNGLVAYIIPEGEEVTDWEEDADENGIIDVQEEYDQFVWVPVENAVLDLSGNATALSTEENIEAAVQEEIDAGRYPMAIKKDATNYFGVLYEFSLDSAKNEVKVELLKNGSGETWTPLCETNTYNREPAYLEDASYADGSSYNNVTPKITESLLQTEFNTMVTKVSDNKGFWVGRYETSNMCAGDYMSGTSSSSSSSSASGSAASDNTKDLKNKIKVIKGTEIGTNSVNWYRMYAQQKSYANLANISSTSSMIWGSQWNQIMIWMKEVKNTSQNSYYVINALSMGNFGTSDDSYEDTSKAAPTGCYEVKNVYDLAGNLYDWTLEATLTFGRVERGGKYSFTLTSGARADDRGYGGPYNAGSDFGSRSSLY